MKQFVKKFLLLLLLFHTATFTKSSSQSIISVDNDIIRLAIGPLLAVSSPYIDKVSRYFAKKASLYRKLRYQNGADISSTTYVLEKCYDVAHVATKYLSWAAFFGGISYFVYALSDVSGKKINDKKKINNLERENKGLSCATKKALMEKDRFMKQNIKLRKKNSSSFHDDSNPTNNDPKSMNIISVAGGRKPVSYNGGIFSVSSMSD